MPNRRTRHTEIVRIFAERLRGQRLARGLTQQDLARKANVSTTYVSTLEAGGAAPGIDLLDRLAVAMQVPVTDLLPVPLPSTGRRDDREQLRELFGTLLNKAGPETLTLVRLFVTRLLDSPSVRR